MLTIDRLRLSLPAGYARRADRIARLVGQELAALPVAHSARIDRVALPAVTVPRGASDLRVATAIASRLAAHLGGGS